MNQIKIQCPAKINLDLRVFPVDNTGFHPIKSIMQTISLFDYLTIKINDGQGIFYQVIAMKYLMMKTIYVIIINIICQTF